ncbi:hypothetical protein EDD86DRAFT_215884 [Gorgonomyces haynaldii]|nr:hypothetical protein EDD86DRAFT_215884 [Gorgonomyces haynaldii]
MYFEENEFTVDEATAEFLNGEGLEPPLCNIVLRPNGSKFAIKITIADKTVIALEQQPHMTRKEHQALMKGLEAVLHTEEDLILQVVAAFEWLASQESTDAPLPIEEEQDTIFREVVYFPSLSSKEKRRDLVEYAQRLNLNGFVTHGKPGFLMVQGRAHDIDRYFTEIRTISWADIPSGHKKMTRVFREETESDFVPMHEFEYHNDLALLRQFLKKHDCESVFAKLFPELK